MAIVEKMVSRCFRRCDWCGRVEDQENSPYMATLSYEVMGEGNHGMPRPYTEQLHICSGGVDNCMAKMCQYVLKNHTLEPKK